MINRLANRRNLARISRKPGKTQSINYFLVEKAFYIVDLPGYGYAKVPKALRSFFAGLVNPYLNDRRELRGIIQLLDARHGPVSGDYEMLEWLKEWDGSVLYVFTKADKLSANGRMKVLKAFEEEYGNIKDTVMFSARKGMGVENVRAWINTTLGIENSSKFKI
jgi:GTP-binding protein